jgi:flagellar hook-associated protein 3 FlgL
VRRESDNRIVSGLSNITLAAGTSIDFHGMSLAISGSPSPGDSFIVESSKNQSLTSSIENLTKGLRSLSDNSIDAERLQNLLADSVINLDNARDKILEVRSQIGGRLNTVESVNKLHDTVNFNNTETLSRLRDVDFAEATSRLAMESFVLEAAQQSYVKISRLSLMSFLR